MTSKDPLVSNDGLQSGTASVTLGLLGESYSPEAVGTEDAKSRGDQRVSLSPTVADLLKKDSYEVIVEKGARIFAGFPDSAYEAVGCRIMNRADIMKTSQVLFCIEPPLHDFGKMANKILISWVGQLTDKGKSIVDKAVAAKITLIDVVSVPRITIAQKLDVLSSQAKVAGHRAVIEATHAFGRFHTAEMTAAGKFPPSQTFVLGCGVAGLAAMGTSKALGSVLLHGSKVG